MSLEDCQKLNILDRFKHQSIIHLHSFLTMKVYWIIGRYYYYYYYYYKAVLMHAYLIEILLYIVPGYAEKKVPYSFDYNIK